MSNQDIEGSAPADEARGAPAGKPASLEQELAKERDARVLMRDRLRHTEALAAESHALRSRMAEELERVTADRDRLRSAAAAGGGTTAAAATAAGAAGAADAGESPLEPTVPLHGGSSPRFTPRAAEWPPRSPNAPPTPPRRNGPWRALAMLGGLAVAVGAVAWFSGSLPGRPSTIARDTSQGVAPAALPATVSPSSPGRMPPPTAATVLADAASPSAYSPSGAVALPPLTPEAQLAAAPTAAGPAPASAGPAPTAAGPAPAAVAVAAADPTIAAPPAGMAARLRKALDGEGIGAPVEIDAASGHVMVADPQADDALRDRTDMLIRAVYAGASLSEPQIEHRWLSPKRAGRPVPVVEAVPVPPAPALAAAPKSITGMTPAQAYAERHAAQDRGVDRKGRKAGAIAAAATVADVEELRPVLPEGRVTASCRASLAGRTPHRADLTACMKTSCCSAGKGQSEDCRAYQKAYPFTCSAG